MFNPLSPKTFVILETLSFSVIRITITSMFFLDFARLNSASSRIFVALAGSSVINLTKPNSPASAIDNANIFIWFWSSFSITSESEPGWLSKKTLTCGTGKFFTQLLFRFKQYLYLHIVFAVHFFVECAEGCLGSLERWNCFSEIKVQQWCSLVLGKSIAPFI